MRVALQVKRLFVGLALLGSFSALAATDWDARYVLLFTLLGFLVGRLLLWRFGIRAAGGKDLYEAGQKLYERKEQIRRMLRRYHYRLDASERAEGEAFLKRAEEALEGGELKALASASRALDTFGKKHLSFARRIELREFVSSTAGFVFVALLFRAFVAEAFEIPSISMTPTLQVGDYIVVSKAEYGLRIPFTRTTLVEFRRPARGDIVVFSHPNPQSPEDVGLDLVKRVVAVEGDTVEMVDGVLIVNGEAVPREGRGAYRYTELSLVEEIPPTPRSAQSYHEFFEGKAHTVLYEEDQGGCGLSESIRCWPRYHGSKVPGGLGCRWPEAFCVDPERRAEPFRVPAGYVFVMGDNRDRSADSRFWGPLPVEHIKGKVAFIGYSGGWFGPPLFRWDRLFQKID